MTTSRPLERRGAFTLACMAALIIIALIVWLAAALAESLPVPRPPPGRGGSCPHGWPSSGSYGVPAQGAQDAIAKPANGACPRGWTASSKLLPA
jgi:hypothetical protein